jgi:NTE family protein
VVGSSVGLALLAGQQSTMEGVMNHMATEDGYAPHKKKALVLSGGGGLGAFECGVMETLTEVGWEPDVLVGTSIGAMNAAVWALDGTEAVARMWGEIRTRDMHRFFRWSPWRSILDRTAWKQTLERYAPEKRLKQVSTPLYIVATDISTGHLVVYTNSEHYDKEKMFYRKVDAIEHRHLLASSAIPYVYPPTLIDGIPHWDGSVMSNSPLRPAVDAGAEQIMIVLISPYHDPHKPGVGLPPPSPGLVAKVGYLLNLMITATFENDFEQMRKINRRVVQGLAAPKHREIEAALVGPLRWLTPLDIIRYRRARIEDLREQGRKAAETTWKRILQDGWDSLGP